MSAGYRIVRMPYGEYEIELFFDADEARNIAAGLASNDKGAEELERAADECDLMNGVTS